MAQILTLNTHTDRYEAPIEDGTLKVSVNHNFFTTTFFDAVKSNKADARDNGAPCSLKEARETAFDMLDAQYWLDIEDGFLVRILPVVRKGAKNMIEENTFI